MDGDPITLTQDSRKEIGSVSKEQFTNPCHGRNAQ